jgi:hypothetical protein
MARHSTEPAYLHRKGKQYLSSLRVAVFGESPAAKSRSWSGFGWQIILLLPPAALYFFVRDLVSGQESEAHSNAAAIVDVERSLGLDWESTLQNKVLHTDWIMSAVNWIYIWGHFPVIVLALFLLFKLSPREYLTLRNALVASGGVGLLCFAFYPVAPPRLFDPVVFFDSLNELSSSYRVLQNPKVTNQFAAVPSFHVGWNLLVAIAVWRASRFRILKVLALLSPMLMVTAVVLTANHWVIDILAGIAVALFGIGAASLMDRFFRRFGAVPAANETQAESTGRGADSATHKPRLITACD